MLLTFHLHLLFLQITLRLSLRIILLLIRLHNLLSLFKLILNKSYSLLIFLRQVQTRLSFNTSQKFSQPIQLANIQIFLQKLLLLLNPHIHQFQQRMQHIIQLMILHKLILKQLRHAKYTQKH